MQIVQFYELERSIQDRFIASSHGREVPTPLLYQRPSLNRKAAFLLSISCGLTLGLLGYAWFGYGKLGHPMAQAPNSALGIYAGLLGSAALALFGAYWFWDKNEKLPFLPGIFLYPIGVIDARSPAIVIHQLSTLKDMHSEGNRLKLSFQSGAIFEFAVTDKAQGESILASLRESQTRVSILPPSSIHPQRDFVLQNPLLDTGFKSPFGPTAPLTPEPFKKTPLWALTATLIGLVLGVTAFWARNHLSAHTLYVKARALDSTQAYTAFVKSGAKAQDVTDILLPRARLRDAIAQGSADAIEAFLDAHPKSKIEPEAVRALREALLRELEMAKQANTLTALRQFRKGDARVLLVEQERLSAETAIYRSALASYQAAAGNNAESLDFVTRLLEYTRKGSGRVEIRFRRKHADSVDNVEQLVKKSVYYIGPPALPSQYFDATHSAPREAKVAATISERFASVFPKDVLSFELGEPLTNDDTEIPTFTVPTLLITHRLDLSGPLTSNKPRGAFVGTSFLFKAVAVIPEDKKPLQYSQSTWIPPRLRLIEEEHKTLPEMYESMAEEAFTRFVNKYVVSLFQSKTN